MRRLILHADDSEDDALLLRTAFEMAGLRNRIVRVSNGQEAINYLWGIGHYSDRLLHPLPHLLLLDLKMPLVDGFDLLEWLGSVPDFKELPVIMLSSSEDPSNIEKARALGARDYLVKPAKLEDLVELVRNLHATWLCKDLQPA
ncbi:MAG: two-component system response regulator [Verrucomicrobia bacterium]|nr:MAG: two-component system response regulator [Verrucomicrobiota bacterium]